MKRSVLGFLALVSLLAPGCASHPGDAPGGRFQVSAFSSESGGNGCYIIDTKTGELWTRYGGKTTKIGESLK